MKLHGEFDRHRLHQKSQRAAQRTSKPPWPPPKQAPPPDFSYLGAVGREPLSNLATVKPR